MSNLVGSHTSYRPLDDDGTPLDLLQQAFGSQLERMSRKEKYALLATIAANLCICCNGEESLYSTYMGLPVEIEIGEELRQLLDPLDSIGQDLIGLCVALANQLHSGVYAEE